MLDQAGGALDTAAASEVACPRAGAVPGAIDLSKIRRRTLEELHRETKPKKRHGHASHAIHATFQRGEHIPSFTNRLLLTRRAPQSACLVTSASTITSTSGFHDGRDLGSTTTPEHRLAPSQRGTVEREGMPLNLASGEVLQFLLRWAPPNTEQLATSERSKQMLTKCVCCAVGSVPLKPPDKIHPGPRLRRRLLRPVVQAEVLASDCRPRFWRGARLRGVQLQSEAGR